MTNPGERVGAIQSANTDQVNFYGYGVYVGNEVHPELGFPNPKIELDNGDIVWGMECWWGPEEAVKKHIDATVAAGAILNDVRK